MDLLQAAILECALLTSFEVGYISAGDVPDSPLSTVEKVSYILLSLSIVFVFHRASLQEFFRWKETMTNLREVEDNLVMEKEQNENLRKQNQRIKEQIQLSKSSIESERGKRD